MQLADAKNGPAAPIFRQADSFTECRQVQTGTQIAGLCLPDILLRHCDACSAKSSCAWGASTLRNLGGPLGEFSIIQYAPAATASTKASAQLRTGPISSSVAVQSSTEKSGRFALAAYSAVVHGVMHASACSNSEILHAASYHVVLPAFVAW
jgi:hypothetical protein